MEANRRNLKKAAQAIKDADALIFTSGAGLGVDSGLPDFRGTEGIWKAYPQAEKLGLKLHEMSDPEWFENDPEFAWGFFGHRMKLYREAHPHDGFQIMKRWGEDKAGRYFSYTSNVDGHFQKAGFPDDKIFECHGSVNFIQDIDGDLLYPVPEIVSEVDMETLRMKQPLPLIPDTNSVARPNVMMFRDSTFNDSRYLEQEDNFVEFVNGKVMRGSLSYCVIEIGSGCSVPTIRRDGESLIKNVPRGTLIRINPAESDIPKDISGIELPMKGLEALKALDKLYLELSNGNEMEL